MEEGTRTPGTEKCPPHDFSTVLEADVRCSRCGITATEWLDQGGPDVDPSPLEREVREILRNDKHRR